MPHTYLRSLSTSPAKNTPENYQLAAREIEQEKQMVAALKRLLFGPLMNLDPDMPPPDASFSFLVDREHAPDPDGELLDTSAPPEPEPAFSTSPDARVHPHQAPAEHAAEHIAEHSAEHSTDSRVDEVLWVPANMHPEVDAQQYKTHVKTALDGLLERRASRRLKRSSLSLSTTGDVLLGDGDGDDPLDSDGLAAHRNADASEPLLHSEGADAMRNPSLRRLTSELQTMSRLAGMDSTDAVTLARSLSTSSLGYSDVERTAIDDLELAAGYHHELNASPAAVPYHSGYMGGLPGRHPADGTPRVSSYEAGPFAQPTGHRLRPHGSPNSSPVGSPGGSFHDPYSDPHGDFALRRTRRVGFRRGPGVSLLGSHLQSSKAGKLAQLRHKISTPSLAQTKNDLGKDRPASQHPELNQRASMLSINPRSSQVLFSYKQPSQHTSHSKSLSPRASQSLLAAAPLAGLSPKDSPYLSAMSSDALGRSISATKYSQHNLTSKSLGHQAALLLHKQSEGGKSPRIGHRSSSWELEQQGAQQISSAVNPQALETRDLSGSRKLRGKHGRRQVSPTWQQQQTPATRISSRGSPVHAQGHWAEQKGLLRNEHTTSLPESSPVLQQSPIHPTVERFEPSNTRSQSKRDKTRELNQNLDLLRNEINEFKESLASKADPKKLELRTFSREEGKAVLQQADLSFDLTHQDVSYEDALAIEGDVLAELAVDSGKQQEVIHQESERNLTVYEDPKQDEIVSVPDSTNSKVSTFRHAMAHDTAHSKDNPEIDHSLLPHERVSSNNDRQKPNVFPTGLKAQVFDENHHNHLARESGGNSETEISQLTKASLEVDKTHTFDKLQLDESKFPKENNKPLQPTLLTDEPQNNDKKQESDIEEAQNFSSESPEKSKITQKNDSPTNAPSTLKDSRSKEASMLPEMSGKNELMANTQVIVYDNTSSYQENEKENLDDPSALSMTKVRVSERKKSKKSWPWSKERSVSLKIQKTKSKELQTPMRSVSSPEISTPRSAQLIKEENTGKENAIAKFFKKRRSSTASHDRVSSDVYLIQNSLDSTESEKEVSSSTKVRGKRHSRSSDKGGLEDILSPVSSVKELKREKVNEDMKLTDDLTVSSRIKNRIKNMKKIPEETGTKPEEPQVDEEENLANDEKPKSTIEVQEKLKKSIKRYSRPNQPIEFTDSAFGFPLPPPSSSTLVMIDYRFPVHVERAIYRLSHLKLANPKRSLREQVILSNFMYAYLNLVDHTLHLEQQMTLEDGDIEQPDGDLDFLGDQDIDTEFEADDGFDDGDFDSIKIDLDLKDTQISV